MRRMHRRDGDILRQFSQGFHSTSVPSGNVYGDKVERSARKPFRAHAFELACARVEIDSLLTKPKHPWTNGQVECMNPTIKDAAVKRYFYESHDELRTHLAAFVIAYNFARGLKTHKGLTPYEFICKLWTKEPERFTLDPLHQMPGLNS